MSAKLFVPAGAPDHASGGEEAIAAVKVGDYDLILMDMRMPGLTGVETALAAFAEFMAALARHDAQGSAHTQRGFQAGRPSLYEFEDRLRQLTLPVLIISGDEDDSCIQPSLFLKQTIPASGLAVFPKTGHVINLEEPALFNETLERFLALVESGRWPPRDPASVRA